MFELATFHRVLPCLGKSHPQDKNKLEGVVESCHILASTDAGLENHIVRTEPVNGVDSTLKDSQEPVYNPVLYTKSRQSCAYDRGIACRSVQVPIRS